MLQADHAVIDLPSMTGPQVEIMAIRSYWTASVQVVGKEGLPGANAALRGLYHDEAYEKAQRWASAWPN